jgi:hypothetical protein
MPAKNATQVAISMAVMSLSLIAGDLAQGTMHAQGRGKRCRTMRHLCSIGAGLWFGAWREIMSWHAETDQTRLDSDTLLTVYWKPWGSASPPHSLSAGASILVHFPGGDATTITVVERTATEATILTSDGAKWKIVEPTLQQRAMAARPPDGVPANCWGIIRKRILP